MKDDLRVVVDTNVLISGLFGIRNSPSSQILSSIRAQEIILVTSTLILEEIEVVINRARIVKLTKMNKRKREDFLNQLIERSDVTAGKQLSQTTSRDIKDDKFLACAYEAKANYLVTGDNDLLVLKEYKGTIIFSPKEFVKLI